MFTQRQAKRTGKAASAVHLVARDSKTACGRSMVITGNKSPEAWIDVEGPATCRMCNSLVLMAELAAYVRNTPKTALKKDYILETLSHIADLTYVAL